MWVNKRSKSKTPMQNIWRKKVPSGKAYKLLRKSCSLVLCSSTISASRNTVRKRISIFSNLSQYVNTETFRIRSSLYSDHNKSVAFENTKFYSYFKNREKFPGFPVKNPLTVKIIWENSHRPT